MKTPALTDTTTVKKRIKEARIAFKVPVTFPPVPQLAPRGVCRPLALSEIGSPARRFTLPALTLAAVSK